MSLERDKGLPEYVELSLKQAYDKLCHSIEEAYKANKARYDKRNVICSWRFSVFVQYVPVMKTGCTKKFSCLWRGQYTREIRILL